MNMPHGMKKSPQCLNPNKKLKATEDIWEQKDSLSQGRAYKLIVQNQMVSLPNRHTSHMI